MPPTSRTTTRPAQSGPAVTGFIAALLLVAACGGDDAASTSDWTAEVDTLDGGAVHVVHTPPTDESPTWTLEPDLRIGAMDGTGADVFGMIVDIDATADGQIAVLDRQTQDIRLFATDGTHLRTFGREGDGPGEFRRANGVVVGPDGRMRVPDMRNARMSLIDPDSGFVGSHPFAPMMYQLSWEGVVDSAGGSWSMHYLVPESQADEGTMVWVHLDRDGIPGDTIRPEPRERDGAGVWEFQRGRMRGMLAVPNYPGGHQAMDPRGRLWSSPRGDPAYRMVRWTADGDTALVIEVDRPLVPTDWDRVNETVRVMEEQADMRLDRSKIPDVEPSLETFFFDRDGRLWVQRHAASDSVRTFDAFEADSGDYLGTLTTRVPLMSNIPPAIRGDTWWGIVRDELDVQAVVRGRMRPAGAGEV